MMRSLYLPGWRQFQPWNWYCIITVISPYWPPISSCMRAASTGSGRSGLASNCSRLSWVYMNPSWGSTLVAARLGGGHHTGITDSAPATTPRPVRSRHGRTRFHALRLAVPETSPVIRAAGRCGMPSAWPVGEDSPAEPVANGIAVADLRERPDRAVWEIATGSPGREDRGHRRVRGTVCQPGAAPSGGT